LVSFTILKGNIINGIKYRLRKKDKIKEVTSKIPRFLAPRKEDKNNTEKESREVMKLRNIGIPLNPITLEKPSLRSFI